MPCSQRPNSVFIHADRIVDLLESRVAAIRARQAVSYSSAPRVVAAIYQHDLQTTPSPGCSPGGMAPAIRVARSGRPRG
jgi:hypothetical protein